MYQVTAVSRGAVATAVVVALVVICFTAEGVQSVDIQEYIREMRQKRREQQNRELEEERAKYNSMMEKIRADAERDHADKMFKSRSRMDSGPSGVGKDIILRRRRSFGEEYEDTDDEYEEDEDESPLVWPMRWSAGVNQGCWKGRPDLICYNVGGKVGNCFYHAIDYLLKGEAKKEYCDETPEDATELRIGIKRLIDEDPTRYENLALDRDVSKIVGLEWAQSLEIQAMADLCRRKIIVVIDRKSGFTGGSWQQTFTPETEDYPPLTVGYVNGNHYVAITDKAHCPAVCRPRAMPFSWRRVLTSGLSSSQKRRNSLTSESRDLFNSLASSPTSMRTTDMKGRSSGDRRGSESSKGISSSSTSPDELETSMEARGDGRDPSEVLVLDKKPGSKRPSSAKAVRTTGEKASSSSVARRGSVAPRSSSSDDGTVMDGFLIPALGLDALRDIQYYTVMDASESAAAEAQIEESTLGVIMSCYDSLFRVPGGVFDLAPGLAERTVFTILNNFYDDFDDYYKRMLGTLANLASENELGLNPFILAACSAIVERPNKPLSPIKTAGKLLKKKIGQLGKDGVSLLKELEEWLKHFKQKDGEIRGGATGQTDLSSAIDHLPHGRGSLKNFGKSDSALAELFRGRVPKTRVPKTRVPKTRVPKTRVPPRYTPARGSIPDTLHIRKDASALNDLVTIARSGSGPARSGAGPARSAPASRSAPARSAPARSLPTLKQFAYRLQLRQYAELGERLGWDNTRLGEAVYRGICTNPRTGVLSWDWCRDQLYLRHGWIDKKTMLGLVSYRGKVVDELMTQASVQAREALERLGDEGALLPQMLVADDMKLLRKSFDLAFLNPLFERRNLPRLVKRELFQKLLPEGSLLKKDGSGSYLDDVSKMVSGSKTVSTEIDDLTEIYAPLFDSTFVIPAISSSSDGSTDPTSDIDIPTGGPLAELVVAIWNKLFRDKFGVEAATAMDVNLYAVDGDMYMRLKQPRTTYPDRGTPSIVSMLYFGDDEPDESFIEYVERQEEGSLLCIRRVVSKGVWDRITYGLPLDRQGSNAEKLYAKLEREVEAQKAIGPPSIPESDRHNWAMNRLYEEKLESGMMAKMFFDINLELLTQCHRDKDSVVTMDHIRHYLAIPGLDTSRDASSSTAALSFDSTETLGHLWKHMKARFLGIADSFLETGYFANEAYISGGALAFVVGNMQGQKHIPMVAEQALQAFNEQLGMLIHGFNHFYETEDRRFWLGKALFKDGKYVQRMVRVFRDGIAPLLQAKHLARRWKARWKDHLRDMDELGKLGLELTDIKKANVPDDFDGTELQYRAGLALRFLGKCMGDPDGYAIGTAVAYFPVMKDGTRDFEAELANVFLTRVTRFWRRGIHFAKTILDVGVFRDAKGAVSGDQWLRYQERRDLMTEK